MKDSSSTFYSDRILPGSLKSLLFTFIIFILMANPVFAQMFSVEETSPVSANVPISSLTAGWEIADFTYSGENPPSSTDRLDFSNLGIFRFQFENPGINMYLGVGGSLTGSEDHNYLNIGATLYNDFPIVRSEQFRLLLPLQLNTDLLRTRTDISTQQFQQTAFQLGAGLAIWNRWSERIQTEARAVPSYGFSNSQGAFVGGSIASLDGKARIHIRQLFGSRGLTIGYNYRFRRYDIDQDIFDYDLNGHSFIIGMHF